MQVADIKKIAVVMGGTSSEKDISLRSGRNVADSLKRLGYSVSEVDPENDQIPEDVDFVYIALHGKGGEDGTIQAELEKKKIAYSGSGVIASVLAFDKLLTKRVLSLYDIPTAEYIVLHDEKDLERIREFPVILKPALEGSSIGVEIADNKLQAVNVYRKLKERFNYLFAEQFIRGKELTVSIVGDKIFPVLELRPKNRFYDFEAKYTTGMTEFILPAEISVEESLLVKDVAKKTYDVLGCKGAARVDVIFSNNIPYVLEVNTSPGMTDTSDLPAQAMADGVEFDALLEFIISNSLC